MTLNTLRRADPGIKYQRQQKKQGKSYHYTPVEKKILSVIPARTLLFGIFCFIHTNSHHLSQMEDHDLTHIMIRKIYILTYRVSLYPTIFKLKCSGMVGSIDLNHIGSYKGTFYKRPAWLLDEFMVFCSFLCSLYLRYQDR